MFFPLILFLYVLPAAGQVPASTEATRIAEGRRLLSEGDAARAAELGRTLLAQFPRSEAVLAFAVDADSARAGARAGLATYERWVGANMIEAPRALHQVAQWLLREHARPPGDPAVRVKALTALAGDGDADAAATLASDELQQAAGGHAPPVSDRAVASLLAQLQSPMTGDRRRAILALGESRSDRAVSPLTALLVSDPNPDIRAAAAEALGKLGATRAVPALKTLLDDPVFFVHYQAATALFALNDQSGFRWLRDLEASPEPGLRLAAAQALRRQPDGAWLALVRRLTTEQDADVRRQAAELLAPHDPEAAKAVLTPLLSDPNVVARGLALASLIQHAEADLGALRRYVTSEDAGTRVTAAARILELTR